MIVLELNNITVSYQDKLVLNNINLKVVEGEIVGLIGLNGAGKTTMIKAILNLITPDNGFINICEKDSKNNISRKNISYLPEKFQPSQQLKAIEFIKIFSENKNLNIEKINRLCNLLSLDNNVLNKKIGSLSKGMSQKIGLINTFIDNKKLVILDEPMSGLDPKARIDLKNLLLDYKKQGNSVFFSSHILSDIDDICDKVAILNNGEIKTIDTPENIKNKNNVNSLEKAFLKEIGL